MSNGMNLTAGKLQTLLQDAPDDSRITVQLYSSQHGMQTETEILEVNISHGPDDAVIISLNIGDPL